jgi:hypothetical protein
MRILVHNRLLGEQSALSLARFVRITNPDIQIAAYGLNVILVPGRPRNKVDELR